MEADFYITVRGDGHGGVVRPHGGLTGLTATAIRRILTKVVHEHGRAVVDLDRCRLGRASCVLVFAAVLDACGGWPKARLALCRPDSAMARALVQHGVSALVPVCESLPEAETALELRPSLVRVRTRLVCDDHAPDVARLLVRDSCPRWQVDAELRQIGELVVSELVDNAVKHARTASALTLERGPHGLRIAVRDTAASPGFTQSTECSRGVRRRGRGLELVARLTTSWGVEMHPVGKTVWAEIICSAQRTRRLSGLSVTGVGRSPVHLVELGGVDCAEPSRLD